MMESGLGQHQHNKEVEEKGPSSDGLFHLLGQRLSHHLRLRDLSIYRSGSSFQLTFTYASHLGFDNLCKGDAVRL